MMSSASRSLGEDQAQNADGIEVEGSALGGNIIRNKDDEANRKLTNGQGHEAQRLLKFHPYAQTLLYTSASCIFLRTAQAHESGESGEIYDDSHILLSIVRAALATAYAKWLLGL